MATLLTKELNDCAKKIFAGNFAEAHALIVNSGLPERYKSLLTSLANFESGKVAVPSKVAWYEQALWVVYTRFICGPKLVDIFVRSIFLVLAVFGLRKLVVERILDQELANLAHYRYTSFIKGLTYSVVLHAGTPKSQRLYRAALKAQISHHAALSGLFGVAERLSVAAVADLDALDREVNAGAITDFLVWGLAMEATTNLFMIYVYKGDKEKKELIFRKGEEQFARHDYVWLKVFYRIVGLHSTTENLDQIEMSRFSSDLMKTLGENTFQTRFALRLSGYTALLLAFQGDYFNAQTQILHSEELYRNSPVPLERARYHYTRALIELELQRFDKALHHAEKNMSMLAPVQGAVFHTIEARLLRVEVLLRSAYARPDIANRATLVASAKKELRSIESKVVDSQIHDVRIESLNIFVKYLEGDYRAVKIALTRIRGRVAGISKRYEKILSQLLPMEDQVASPTLSEDEILHKQSLYVIEQLSCLHTSEDIQKHAVALVLKIFGSREGRLIIVRGARSAAKDYLLTFHDKIIECVIPIGADLYKFEITGSPISAEYVGLVDPFLKLFATLLNVILLQDLDREKARFEAIEKTTQMLAHDVRRPFSMMKAVMAELRHAKSIEDVRAMLDLSESDVGAALVSVTGMLQDVMDVGSQWTLDTEDESPDAMIEMAVREVSRFCPDADLKFKYDMQHSYKVAIDTLKVQRVFSNIVSNAVQAMSRSGQIWFRTRNLGEMVEFTIGNAGSTIPPDDLEKLFEPFFTKGKQGGTGLGLAIAKKIVEAHGGKIWCQSTALDGVEFFFTLPASLQTDSRKPSPPPSSREVQESLQLARARVVEPTEGLIAVHEDEIIGHLGPEKIRLLVVDDEAVYRNAIAALIRSSERLKDRCEVVLARDSAEALALVVQGSALAIIDYDLGEGSLNGIDLTKAIRAVSPHLPICIHSNRIGGQTYKEAVDAGADHFLPKPISKAHLFRLIANSFQVSKGIATGAAAITAKRNTVILLDDDSFAHTSWK